MSNTYRTTLVYTKDGHYGLGCTARTKAAELKKKDRRTARRESKRIKEAALRELEEDAHEDLLESIELEREEADYDLEFWRELEREMQLEDERRDIEMWERECRYEEEMRHYDSYEYSYWDY